MPEDGEDNRPAELSKEAAEPIAAEPVLPPVVPPTTKTPFQFNQQINIQQIPPKALEKLSAEQLYNLSNAALAQFERSDERHFKYALEQIKSSARTQRIAMGIGSAIAIGGIAAVTYLATEGHQVVAAVVGTFLATVIAMTIGNRFFD